MTETLTTPAAVADMQAAFASWSRACTQVAEAMTKAGIAQAELARGLMSGAQADLDAVRAGGSARESGQAWMQATHVRMLNTVDGWRKINDTLLTGLFAAAETLTAALPETKLTELGFAGIGLAETPKPVSQAVRKAA